MRVKLLKSVIVNSVSNTEATRAEQVVEVDDAEGKELVKSGYAEETTSKVTAQARQAPEPDNKMAPEPANKTTGTTPRATVAAGAARSNEGGARTAAKTTRRSSR